MMRIILKNQDGSVSVLYPVLECGLTVEQIAEKDSHGTPYEIVEDSEIPADQDFRNAWKHDLTVDISKAKEITKERLRKERQPLLEALDTAFLKALEAGADTTAIVTEKQRLRDITKAVDTLTTVEELKEVRCE